MAVLSPLRFAAGFASAATFSVLGFPAACDGEAPVTDGGGAKLSCEVAIDLSDYDYSLDRPRSTRPPAGLEPSEVPQFVSIGWDDNGFLEAFDWGAAMLDALGVNNTFFLTTTYISEGSTRLDPGPLRRSLRDAYLAGNEFGNHTQRHLDGSMFGGLQWRSEVSGASFFLTQPFESQVPGERLGIGIPPSEIYGFRSPFLNYSDALFDELRLAGIWYDCSIEEGWQLTEDASSFPWPYTLDEGSAGHEYARQRGFEAKGFPLEAHPGMIELPAYALQVPPDSEASAYGFEEGLLARIRELIPEREPGSDRITGLDFNLWSDAELSKEEFVAVLKYNLDRRLEGNRAPFLFGAHTDFYREDWNQGIATFTERREAMEEFLAYAKSLPDVRLTTHKEVVDFIRAPRPLECFD